MTAVIMAGAAFLLIAFGVPIVGAVWNYKAKRSGTIHTHNAGQSLRPELEGSPAELISTAYERTELPS